MGSGNEQEYTVYKGRRKRARRKVTPLIVDDMDLGTSEASGSGASGSGGSGGSRVNGASRVNGVNGTKNYNSDNSENNTPKAIQDIIRIRWHNDLVSTRHNRIKMGKCSINTINTPHDGYENCSVCISNASNAVSHPPGIPSPVKFFENSTTARMFQIAQQHPPEYIPVPVMKPYMIPLYPDKEFYDGHGFIPSQFLVQHDD